jgi:hypothetical protein
MFKNNAKIHQELGPKFMKNGAGIHENHENRCLGRFGRPLDSGAFVASRTALWRHHLMIFGRPFGATGRFWTPFWTPVDFEGGPKIAFSGIMLQKNEKKEVQERFQEKHEILMDF